MRILYVDIDSLRPDHLSCYGYGRPTSPVIDGVAARGARFTNYFVSDSPCVPSRAACFSGRPGIRNGVVAHEDTPLGSTMRYSKADRNGDAPMLMNHLAAAGYTTVSFTSFANRHLAGWFHFGFRQFHLSSLKNGNEDADEVNAVALPWFQQHAAKDNWFVHLNYWDPHTLYTEPTRYMEEMAKHPAPAWPDEATIAEQQSLIGVRTPRHMWTLHPSEGGGKSRVPTMPDQLANRRDFEHLMNGYDGAIRYVDEQLGLIFDELERQGVLAETAVIISADHGEAFGELGQYIEHGSVSPAVHCVPLIVAWPGLTDAIAGSQRDELLSNLDFAPTIADALGLEVPSGWCGRGIVPLLRGQQMDNPRDVLYWGHGLHTRQRAVYDGRFLYIRTYHPGTYEYPPKMLFDLSADPHQTNDLADSSASEVERLDGLLRAWEQDNVAATGQTDPMRDVQVQPPSLLTSVDAYLDRLRNEGRDADAQALQDHWRRMEHEYAPQPISQ